jgi:dUTPase
VRRRTDTNIWKAAKKWYAELVRLSGLRVSVDPLKPLPVVFEPLHADVLPPERATVGSAGFDLRAYLVERQVRCSDGVSLWEVDSVRVDDRWSLELRPGTMALIPLGFRARLRRAMRRRSGLGVD